MTSQGEALAAARPGSRLSRTRRTARATRRVHAALALSALLAAFGCAPALRPPRPIERLTATPETSPSGADPATLLARAAARFAARPDPTAVAEAQELYLAAARSELADPQGPIGVVRVAAWRIEHEPVAAARDRLVALEIDAVQWCGQRAPGSAACDYWLAVALGQQARERPATAADGLARMVAALRRAAAAAPDLERAGPDRVLALVLLRAPGWPAGPGDPEEGLAAARRAVAASPDYAPNQLALGEALRANDQDAAARDAFARAADLARAANDPDAGEWLAEADRALSRR